MPAVSEPLYVEAEQIGIYWSFQARCFVEDPPESGNWRPATAGEVEVLLEYLGEWWSFPYEMERKNSNASGNVDFAGTWGSGAYAMEASHNVSKDRYRVRIDTHDDGTYDVTVEIA